MPKRMTRFFYPILLALLLALFHSSAYTKNFDSDQGQVGAQEQPNVKLNAKSKAGQEAGEESNRKTRGNMLYENHCTECHESNLHIRANRKARSKEDIARWVRIWSDHLKLKWSEADRSDVVDYLRDEFYKF